jgi:hypothetical protein
MKKSTQASRTKKLTDKMLHDIFIQFPANGDEERQALLNLHQVHIGMRKAFAANDADKKKDFHCMILMAWFRYIAARHRFSPKEMTKKRAVDTAADIFQEFLPSVAKRAGTVAKGVDGNPMRLPDGKTFRLPSLRTWVWGLIEHCASEIESTKLHPQQMEAA